MSVLAGCIVAFGVFVTGKGVGVVVISIVGEGDDVGDVAAQPVNHSIKKTSEPVKEDDLVFFLKDMCVLTGQPPLLLAYFH